MLRRYRSLDILEGISSSDHRKVQRELRKVKSNIANGIEFRLDTVFRAMIGYMNRHPPARTTINRAFISDIGDQNRDFLHSLNNTQMLRYIQQMESPITAFEKLRKDICKADFGGPKASFLHMMRKYRSQLAALGMTKRKAHSVTRQIDQCSSDSDVIREYCIPVVREQYK